MATYLLGLPKLCWVCLFVEVFGCLGRGLVYTLAMSTGSPLRFVKGGRVDMEPKT